MSEILDAKRVTLYYFAGEVVMSVGGKVVDESPVGVTLVTLYGLWFLPWTSVQRMVKEA